MASFALEHLTFSYPGQARPALDDLTLTIPEGAVTVLCGESGSGKSTLLRQLKTCLTPHGRDRRRGALWRCAFERHPVCRAGAAHRLRAPASGTIRS